jgi:hypothetical protein
MAQTKKQHIEYIDIDGSGVLKEVVIVKRWEDDSFSYIETGALDAIDKGRLKNILVSPHADKYELWELLSMSKINNGMNALDYFHQLTKKKNPKGSTERVIGGSLRDARPVSDKMIGSEFTNPGEIVGEARDHNQK